MATNGFQNAVNGRLVTINENELQPMTIELRLLQFKTICVCSEFVVVQHLRVEFGIWEFQKLKNLAFNA